MILPIYERFRWSRKSAHIGVTIFNYTWHSGQKWFKKLQFGGLLKAIKSPKLKTFMFHIVRNTHYWIGTQNYECQILMEKRPFFKAKWPYSLQIFSLVSLVKKSATCKAIWPFKKAIFPLGSGIHSFLRQIINLFYYECGKESISNVMYF